MGFWSGLFAGPVRCGQVPGSAGKLNQQLHKACQQEEAWSALKFSGSWLCQLCTSEKPVEQHPQTTWHRIITDSGNIHTGLQAQGLCPSPLFFQALWLAKELYLSIVALHALIPTWSFLNGFCTDSPLKAAVVPVAAWCIFSFSLLSVNVWIQHSEQLATLAMSICVLASYWKVSVTVLFFVLESSVYLSRQQSWWLWSHTARPIKGSGKLCMSSGLISCAPSLSKWLEIKAWNSSLNKSIYNTSFTFWNGWQKNIELFHKILLIVWAAPIAYAAPTDKTKYICKH